MKTELRASIDGKSVTATETCEDGTVITLTSVAPGGRVESLHFDATGPRRDRAIRNALRSFVRTIGPDLEHDTDPPRSPT